MQCPWQPICNTTFFTEAKEKKINDEVVNAFILSILSSNSITKSDFRRFSAGNLSAHAAHNKEMNNLKLIYTIIKIERYKNETKLDENSSEGSKQQSRAQ